MNAAGRVVRSLAERWGVSEGQVYTAVIGVVVALAAAIGGIPPTLRDRPDPASGGATLRTQRSAPARQSPTAEARTVPEVPAVFPGAAAPDVASRSNETPERETSPGPERLPTGAFRVFATVPLPGAPQGIVAAPDGRVVVATNNGNGRGAAGKPVVFAYASGAAVPTKAIPASMVTSGGGIHDLMLPPGGTGDVVYALSSEPPAVLLIDVAKEAVSSFVTVPDLPPCTPLLRPEPCEISPVDRAPLPVAGTFDADGNLIVVDAAQGVLWRVKADRSITVFFKARDFVALDGLSGIARGHDGALFLTVAQSAVAPGKGVVYRLANGGLSQFAQTDDGTLPRGLTSARSGRLYVTLSGTGRVLVLDRAGKAVSTLPTDAASTYDTPVRVAFGPSGLFVVEQAPTRPHAGRVVEVGVDDEGLPAVGP